MNFYLHPLFVGGVLAFLGIIWGVIGGLTGNMASKRGLKWQTAFLLSFVVPVPLLLAIYSGRTIENENPDTRTRWLKPAGSAFAIFGTAGLLALVVYVEYQLAVPIRALVLEPVIITVLAAVLGLVNFFGASFLTACLVARWNYSGESIGTLLDGRS